MQKPKYENEYGEICWTLLSRHRGNLTNIKSVSNEYFGVSLDIYGEFSSAQCYKTFKTQPVNACLVKQIVPPCWEVQDAFFFWVKEFKVDGNYSVEPDDATKFLGVTEFKFTKENNREDKCEILVTSCPKEDSYPDPANIMFHAFFKKGDKEGLGKWRDIQFIIVAKPIVESQNTRGCPKKKRDL